MSSYSEDAAVAFVIYCDTHGLTVEQGEALAEQVADAVQSAAEDRDQYADREVKEP